MQRTRVLKVDVCRLVSGNGERTRGCRLSLADQLEKVHNTGGVANDLGCSSVEDRRCASYYRFSVHRNAIERCLPVTLSTNGVSALATNQCFRATADIVGQ